MMSVETSCPDPARLSAYVQSDLPPAETALLDQHLTDCRDCFERFARLGRDSAVRHIPGYLVVKQIGRGRFGVVYKAWQLTEPPRRVALKLLDSLGDMERSRFEREISVLTRLDSPRIVKCLDSGVCGDSMYYVMDFVDGVHLDKYLASKARDLNDKLAVLERVCRAVADAHAQHVVHRDLKPGNILIDSTGQPHILDFGICSVETSEWSSWERFTITHPGDVIGTLKYMSPEQAWGGAAGTIDERTDMWALGVMLFFVLTDGDFPYSLEPSPDKPIHEAVLERIRRELPRIPRLDHLPRGRDLRALLERCLAWDPDQRVATATDLADDLRRYQAGERVKAKPLGVAYRLKRLAVGAAVRSRGVFFALFLAGVASALWIIPLLTTVGWRERGVAFQGSPPSAPGAAAGDPRTGLVVVGVFDDTPDAVVRFAAETGIEGVTRKVTTWRAVHGHLMVRLARVHPRAVVWDYFFRSPQRGDARIASGINTLEEAGVPVVLAAFNYRRDGTPDLSDTIVSGLTNPLRHGAIPAREMVQRPGEFVVAVQSPNGTVVPSLALTTLAALLHPQTRLELDWPARDKPLNLLYALRSGAYLRERDPLELTRSYRSTVTGAAVRTGNLVACATLELAPPERWEERTIPYQRLLTCPEDRLREWVGGKLVIVGNLTTRRSGLPTDRHAVRYGTSVLHDVPGSYLQADAMAGLLDRRYIKAAMPPGARRFGLMMLAAAAGCLLPIRLSRARVFHTRRHRRALEQALWVLSAASLVTMVVSDSFAAVHIGMTGVSLLPPLAGSFWVEFVRNRHRVLAQKKNRVLNDFGLAIEGATTLMQTPGRSHSRKR